MLRWIASACALALLVVCSFTAAWQAGLMFAPAIQSPIAKPEIKAPDPEPTPALPEPIAEPIRPEVVKPRVAPLGREADHVEMGDALKAYFAARGVSRALIMKDGADQLSFSLNTRDDESLAQIRADIESLLGNYDRAEITLRNGRLSYTLLASGRP
jgi:hypothetical protein